jgi:DDE superfamily endonuclease
METRQEQCPAPGDVALETVREWPRWLTEVERGLMPHFARREAQHRAWASSRGLLSPAERKNGWQLAEVNGDAPPYGVRPLLGRARWDADAVRDALRAYLVKSMGDPHAVRGLDETGCLKKGPQSGGVARQDRGTAGRGETCHMGGAGVRECARPRLAGPRPLSTTSMDRRPCALRACWGTGRAACCHETATGASHAPAGLRGGGARQGGARR